MVVKKNILLYILEKLEIDEPHLHAPKGVTLHFKSQWTYCGKYFVIIGYGQEFEWPKKHHRHKPLVLKHVHKNVYKHRDTYGNDHYLHVGT